MMINLLPRFLRSIKDYQDIFDTEQSELDLIEESDQEWHNENFIVTAEDKGLEFWEDVFKLSNVGKTLEERRTNIRANLNANSVINMDWLENQLNAIAGAGRWVIELTGYSLTIKISPSVYGSKNAIIKAIRDDIPANLVLTIEEIFRKWSEISSTWANLSATYDTWQELKEVN